ncbi:phage tail assembly chaperone [Bradyrhizobium sp. Pha-3]|uniref:phage tail assembly chaperone n=1 Tax=Bradyrhizobium sp. Pha-3 TaxID=208375 RepID=UPI0035D47557
MRLANDGIAISLDNETIHLRATLRAAFRLERAYGGFQKLSEAIYAAQFSTFEEVIRLSAVDPDTALDRYYKFVLSKPLVEVARDLVGPLLKFVELLAGVDGEQSDTKSTGTPMSFEEGFTKLFRIATGWLGWTPEQAWNATPAEIMEAYQGRMEMLSAIFGSGKDKESGDTTSTNISSARDRLGALGNLTVHNMAEVPL